MTSTRFWITLVSLALLVSPRLAGAQEAFNNADSLQRRAPCQSGFFLGPGGCQICDAGSSCDGTTETPCAAGSYTSSQGQSQCTKAQTGYFAIGTGAGGAGATGQQPCPPGSFTSSSGQSTCTLCAAGRYQSQSGQGGCNFAQSGFYAYGTGPGGTGATIQQPCNAGSSTNSQTGQASCTPCYPGTYQPQSGQSMCLLADYGYSASGPGATSEQPCAPGSASSVHGSSQCDLCPAGFYQPQSAQSSCDSAQAGYFAFGPGPNGHGATSEQPCGVGFYSNIRASSCTPCPSGYYCSSQTTSSPTPCPAGRFSTGGAGQDCSLCPPGQFQALSGQTSCCKCCQGFYNDQSDQPHCFPCGNQTPYSNAGASSCSATGPSSVSTCDEGNDGTCPATAPGTQPSTRALPLKRELKRKCAQRGLTACPQWSNGKLFECIDTQTALESCGGCVDYDGTGNYTGVDCSAIPGVNDVACKKGACVVSSCLNGYVVSPDKKTCVLDKLGSILRTGRHRIRHSRGL